MNIGAINPPMLRGVSHQATFIAALTLAPIMIVAAPGVTPRLIIAFDNAAGVRVGIFGPVITRVPDRDLSLQLWDGLTSVMAVPGFWELKRTRTERPEFGKRP